MIFTIFDSKNKTEKHITLSKENGKITCTGYIREKGKKKELPENALEDLINLIKLKDFSNYIGEKEGYRLYEDEYKYIHFFKDGKEDYIKFLRINGKNAILNDLDLPSPEQVFQRFLSAVAVSFIVLGAITLYFSPDPTIAEKRPEVAAAMQVEETAPYVECHSVEEVQERILSIPSLTEQEKAILTNKTQLETAIKYSNGEIYEKLGWGVYTMYCDTTEGLNDNTGGYYMPITPLTLYINETDYDGDGNPDIQDLTTSHEFDHYLQNPNCPRYLKEVRSTETEEEIYGYTDSAYAATSAINYAILKTLVSEDALMEYIYSHSDNADQKFKTELLQYVSESFYSEFIELLSPDSSSKLDDNQYQNKVMAYLLSIAQAKYGDSTKDNYNQLIAILQKDPIVQQQLVCRTIKNITISYETAIELGIVEQKTATFSKAARQITLDEYVALSSFYEQKQSLGSTTIEYVLTEKGKNELAREGSELSEWYEGGYFCRGYIYQGKALEGEDGVELGFLRPEYYEVIRVYEGTPVPEGYEPFGYANHTETTFEYYITPTMKMEPVVLAAWDGEITYSLEDLIRFAFEGINKTPNKAK